MNKLYFLCGLPASGKSTYCEQYKHNKDWVVLSSDKIRAELGDVNDQSRNEEVFKILHSIVKNDLRAGKNVCYDATNLSRRRRIYFIQHELRDIPCEKVCVLFATPYEICLKNNANRERKVPEEVIEKMYKSFNIPCKQEGWDEIQIVWYDYKKDGIEFDYFKDLMQWCQISHDNPNHSLSIGNHMLSALKYYWVNMCDVSKNLFENYILSIAVLMHDCGKVFCKQFVDSKCNPSETAHFYNHHNFGSYLSLFYLKEMKFTDEDILYISLLIELHMRPFLAWDKSEKSKEKDRRLFGDDIISNIGLIHKCDLAAH